MPQRFIIVKKRFKKISVLGFSPNAPTGIVGQWGSWGQTELRPIGGATPSMHDNVLPADPIILGNLGSLTRREPSATIDFYRIGFTESVQS